MRRAVSFLMASVMVASSVPVVSAQKANLSRKNPTEPQVEIPKKPSPKVNPKARVTKFGLTEAYTQGNGVWVRWQMEAEYDNPGFFVYRIDADGEHRVSEFEPGSQFKYGNQMVSGESYTFFDEGGTAASIYYVETAATNKPTRTGTFAVSTVKEFPKVDGKNVFEFAPKNEDQIRPTAIELSLPEDLRAEVSGNLVQPDPVKHREVISQPGVKITAKDTGVVRVTRNQLQTAGFDVNSDSANWQLYTEGVEMPIIIGPNGDYIEFIGRAFETNESDTRAYFLIAGAQPGKRIRVAGFRPTFGTVAAAKYSQTTVKKERNVYSNQILNGQLENFWGRVINVFGTDFNFTLTGIDQTPGDRTVTVALQGFSITGHNIEITLNGNVLAPVTGFAQDAMSKTYSVPVGFLVEGQNVLRMKSTTVVDTALFNYISIDFPRKYMAEGNRLSFFTENYKITRMSGFTSPNVRIFDVTYEAEPVEITGAQMVETAGSFGPVIPANRSRLYYATEATNFAVPVSVTPNNPALLSVPSESGQLVIIAHQTLMPEAQTWANYRSNQGTVTKVVNVEEIYDEFSFGVSSSFAIEAFLNYAKQNWQVKPDYVLLIGDGSYDPKNYLNFGNWNMVPARMVSTLFEETGSDEALADFNDDGLAELAIGRISARDGQSVTTIYNKMVNWESNLTANSLDRGALFAFDQPDGYNFEAMSNNIASRLPAAMPKTFVKRGVPDSGSAQAALISGFNSGKYIVNYSGHGTSGAWYNSSFFSNGQVASLTNASSPSLITALTCLNGYFVSPSPLADSLAEAFTKASNGGAVAIWASTGRTTPDVQEVMAVRFYEQLALGSIPRLGDLIKDAKGQVIAGTDVRLSWALIGDPMLKVR